MNASQIHLALTHVPVILSFAGLVILIFALIRKNDSVTKTAFYIFLTAGLFAIPVYLTGEGAEEVVEDLAGVSEGIIGRHEQFANISLTIILISAVISIAALFLYRSAKAVRVMKYAVLLFAFASAGAMAQTAHLGGQIRHSEIRSASTASGNNKENAESKEAGNQEQDAQKNEAKDDDD